MIYETIKKEKRVWASNNLLVHNLQSDDKFIPLHHRLFHMPIVHPKSVFIYRIYV